MSHQVAFWLAASVFYFLKNKNCNFITSLDTVAVKGWESLQMTHR